MIWVTPFTLDLLNQRSQNTMAAYCGIIFTAFDDHTLTATMPLKPETQQPLGILHGGASCVLAETVGSTGANYCINLKTHYCVGLSIDVNHIRSVRSAQVTAIGKPLHCGQRTQVWQIHLYDYTQQLTAAARLTVAVLERKP